jgi:hypothetical protein
MILLRHEEAAAMAKRKTKRLPKNVLKLADMEQSKSAVLTSLSSASSQRSYDHAIREFVEWYCSEPRLAFNKTVVTRYRISLEQRHYAPSTINLRLAAVRRLLSQRSIEEQQWQGCAIQFFLRYTTRARCCSPKPS